MDSIFSAKEPSLGYLYQVRYGLMLIVNSESEDSTLLIERIDDISIDSNGILDVYQTKLHINSVANLTNASPDLWKTLRVWCENIKSGLINPDASFFNLITTASASDNTIPHNLKSVSRSIEDNVEIINALNSVISTSESQTNKSSYDAFNSLTQEQKEKLVKNMLVVDSSIDINQSKEKVLQSLKFYATNKEALYERLEGWFVGEVIKLLQGTRNAISFAEVKNKVLEIADSFKMDNLPNDFNHPIYNDPTALAPYNGYRFVKQLEIIGVGQKTINIAISDYYRAFSQKSRWLRDGLIFPTDEIEYHNKLKEDWERKFVIVSDTTGQDEEAIKQNGKRFYETHYQTTIPQVFIKDRFREVYMITGCCQELSDKKQIGWHPNFDTLL
jgi:hypothetical protein